MRPPLPFRSSDTFVFRTPTLPFDFLADWFQAPPASADLATRRENLRLHLRAAVLRPEIRDALFMASPDLEEMLDPWLNGDLAPDRRSRVDQSLLRYLVRMASRPTPFGLFAGCSLATWSDSTRLATAPWRQGVRHTRLDMDYLCALVEALEKDPAVRSVLRYRPNSSLYTAAGRFRYAEARLQAERGRQYHLIALDKTPYLEETLERAATGATLAELATPLAVAGVTLEEAAAFIHELIDSQVLVSDLYPAVTGPEPIHGVIDRLRAEPATAPLAVPLERIRTALQTLDDGGLGQDPARYRSLAQELAALPAKIKLKYLFQVDLMKPAPEARLNAKVRTALTEAVALLRRLTPVQTSDPFKDFKRAFTARYEARWVPLAEALDDEIGIGFSGAGSPMAEAAPLLEGLAFPGRSGPEGPAMNPRNRYLLSRVLELGPAPEWELTDADLQALENPEPRELPDAFACMASVAATGAQALDDGDFQLLLEAYSGPSGARLLGRFCHGDPGLEALVKAHLQGEADLRPEALFAEIAHLPEGRMGNILCRPVVRGHEIPFLGVSGAAGDRQLPLQDLLVSVQNDRVVLRSARLGQEVVPRLTSAHNFGRGLSVYRFLCTLQDQGVSNGGWSWGPLESAPYLPRVRRGRHVLQKARWQVRQEEIRAMATASPDEAFQAFAQLRARRGLPRLVVLVDGDNELLVDLESPLWVETLLHLVAKRKSFCLQELYPGPQELLAEGPEGRFCHELVVPFLRIPNPAPPSAQPAVQGHPEPGRPRRRPQGKRPAPPERTFLPGSEWLYLKIYTGTSSADQLLLHALGPFLEARRDLFDRWFFLRYSDPEPHLRLRLHGRPSRLWPRLLPALHALLAPLCETGLIWKLQVDTYERELERYGGPRGILLAEELFGHDSQAVLELVNAYPGDAGAPWRWRMGLRAVDALLDDLGFDLEAKAGLISRARAGFSREFQAQQGLDVQLGEKFRAQRQELDGFLFEPGADAIAQPGLAILAARSQAWRPCLEALRAAEQDGSLLLPRAQLALSYTHMHLNRLLRSAQRAQEFVIYDFLDRLYHSRLARRRKAPLGSASN